MKKFLSIIMCVAILAGCTKTEKGEKEHDPSPTVIPTESPVVTATPLPVKEKFQFTEENFPRIDGSTATIPLIEAVECVLLEKSRTDVIVNIRKTSGAYEALANNEADILLVYDGGEETRKYVKADELFETVPIGKDALVFLVNKDNPVDNITTEQVQKIFSGEYTNWSQLGGNDETIKSYQRGIGSGSQAIMDKLVMKEIPMAEPARIQVIGSMGGLLDAVANFVGGPTGIGYNVFYYVTEMKKNEYIKLVSIDGVEPTYETVQSGEYPFVSEFYSVIRKSEPADSPARALHEWMLTGEAQNLMASEGYVALWANPDADTPRVEGEYAMYPEGEEPVYFSGANPYALTPSNDYGKLYFYLGTSRKEEYSYPNFYGLCTADGKIVTEPIYTIATLLTDSKGNSAYLCFRSDLARRDDNMSEDSKGREGVLENPAILFATDGSWVKEYDDAQFCYGFAITTESIINADFIAVKKEGKWGGVDMKGETFIPFDMSTADRIYEQNESEQVSGMLRITMDRYLSENELYDEKGNLLTNEIKGWPMPGVGDYFVTTASGSGGDSSVIYTYTLDGTLIAKMEPDKAIVQAAIPFGEYVMIRFEEKIGIYDRQLKELYEIPFKFDRYEDNFSYVTQKQGVIFDSDMNTKFHRTYLPDGRRLVTWYDPDMGEDFSQYNQ